MDIKKNQIEKMLFIFESSDMYAKKKKLFRAFLFFSTFFWTCKEMKNIFFLESKVNPDSEMPTRRREAGREGAIQNVRGLEARERDKALPKTHILHFNFIIYSFNLIFVKQ